MPSKKELVNIIKKIFLDTLRSKDLVTYINEHENEYVECIVCHKRKRKYFYASYPIEEYIDSLDGEEGDVICNYSNGSSTFHNNYESAIYYDVIDTICKECVDIQLLLPEESFYTKVYNYTKKLCQKVD